MGGVGATFFSFDGWPVEGSMVFNAWWGAQKNQFDAWPGFRKGHYKKIVWVLTSHRFFCGAPPNFCAKKWNKICETEL